MSLRKGSSPLARYAKTRNLRDEVDDLQLFLRKGWGIDQGYPLVKAARRGDEILMEEIIYQGADIYLAMRKSEEASTIKRIASVFNYIRRDILEDGIGGFWEGRPLCSLAKAAQDGNIERCRQLIAEGAEVATAMMRCGEEGEAAIDLICDAVWDLAVEVMKGQFRKPKVK